MYSLHCGEHATELWQELDPSRGGCISLWELDSDSVSLLVKCRSRMLAVLMNSGEEEEMDANVMYTRLTHCARPERQGLLELHEFRVVAKSLGLNAREADRAFACLDHFPSGLNAHPARLEVSDFVWLKRLPNLIDTEAVACARAPGFQPDVSMAYDTPQDVTGSPIPDSQSPLSGYNSMLGGSSLSAGPQNGFGTAGRGGPSGIGTSGGYPGKSAAQPKVAAPAPAVVTPVQQKLVGLAAPAPAVATLAAPPKTSAPSGVPAGDAELADHGVEEESMLNGLGIDTQEYEDDEEDDGYYDDEADDNEEDEEEELDELDDGDVEEEAEGEETW